VLDAFDARGRKVARLFEGTSSGNGSAAWDGRDRDGRATPAGMIWLRLATRAGETLRTTRIVLLP
jgi:hypothetical protein